MAKPPKNEHAIKTAIAALVTTHTSMKNKAVENIRLSSKSVEYVPNGTGGNLGIKSEKMVFWTSVFGKPDEDYSAFENAIYKATDESFNGLQMLDVFENTVEGTWRRIYKIKVN